MTAFERSTVAVPGGSVALALHLPATRTPVACVLACHGLGASKESDKYLLLGEELPRAGLALARFDFRGCGESTGIESETTVASRIEDALAVLERLARHPRLDTRVGLLGSSMGGFVALHVAAARGDGTPVVTWNAPAEMGLRTWGAPGAPQTPQRSGRPGAAVAPLDNAIRSHALSRPDPPSGLGPAFFAEVESGRYVTAPAGLPRHLVVQADADDVVPPVHGEALHARAADPKALLVILEADHRLSDPGHRRRAVEASRDWLLEFLA